MSRIRTLLLSLGLLALTSPIATDAMAQESIAVASSANLSEAALVPGDMIRLSFWREPGLNGDYMINESGRVVLPLLGARYVSSSTPTDLIDQLTDDYDAHLNNQQVNITLLRRVRILGSVNNPGIYHINPTMNLSDALALAGGATTDGKLSAIELIRGNKKRRANLEQISFIGEHIQSGDQIFVPQRSWASRNSRVLVGGFLSAATLIVTQAIFR